MRILSGLHLIVSGERALEIARIGDELGVAAIQLREKENSISHILHTADALRSVITRSAFIINDRVDIAKAVGAEGVHLGQEDLPIAFARAILGDDAIVGVSTASVEQAVAAEQAGASYLGFGHLYPTASKQKETPPRSKDDLQAVVSRVRIPVIAIGGITALNATPVLEIANGVAVIGAVQSAADPRRAILELLEIIAKSKACATIPS
jgi:thiamine-phosphate pyrophosphorylase